MTAAEVEEVIFISTKQTMGSMAAEVSNEAAHLFIIL